MCKSARAARTSHTCLAVNLASMPPPSRQSIFKTAMNASLGTDTLPTWRMRFLPSFCFSKSFFLRVMSPP